MITRKKRLSSVNLALLIVTALAIIGAASYFAYTFYIKFTSIPVTGNATTTTNSAGSSQNLFSQQTASTVTVKASGKEVTLELVPINETTYRITPDTQYCGAPVVGANARKGQYALSIKGSLYKLPVGTYEFVANTSHDGGLLSETFNGSAPTKPFIFFYAYESCGLKDEAFVYALSDDQKSLVQYTFSGTGSGSNGGVCVSNNNIASKSLLPKDSAGFLQTACYNEDTNKYDVVTWQADTTKHIFVQKTTGEVDQL